MPTTLYDLYEPLAAPGPSGGSVPPATTAPATVTPPTGSPQAWGTEAQQAMVGALTGTAPSAPPASLPLVDTKSTTAPPPVDTKSTTAPPAPAAGAYTGAMFEQEEIANVGGVVDTTVDRTAKIAEAVYEEDELLAGMKAAEGGYTKMEGQSEEEQALAWATGMHIPLLFTNKSEKTGKSAGRAFKQDDRRKDRARRNQEKKECLAAGGSRKKCRQAKGKERKRERKQRREVFDEYQDYTKGK